MSLVTGRDQATFLRAGLLLGLVSGELVIRWAESVIVREPEPPIPIFDLVVTAPGDLTAMRAALAPLADPTESEPIVRELLAAIHRDLEDGRRTVADTVTVLSHLRTAVRAAPSLRDEIAQLGEEFMLATASVEGDLDAKGETVRRWLHRFADPDGDPPA